MKFFGLPKKELDYMATLEWAPLMNYLEKKYGVEYRDEVAKRLDKVMKKNKDKKLHSKKMSIDESLREKLK
jgi:hypothetical protein